MKKIIIAVLLSAMMLVCGCVADMGKTAVDNEPQVSSMPESTPEPPAITLEAMPAPTEFPDPNPETINSLIERMQNNKATNSFEGFTGKSTIIDVVNGIGADKIGGACLSYKTKLAGFSAVVTYNFNNSGDGTLGLTSMYFYVMPEQQGGFKKQLQKFAGKLEAGLGDPTYFEALDNHTPGDKHPDYCWERGNYSVILTSEGQFTPEGVLAFVNFTPLNDYDMPGIFPDIAVGTDIHTVYDRGKPVPGLEEITLDPWAYNLYYTDRGTPVNMIFKVQGSDIKLCQAEYSAILPDTGNENIGKCFKSLGDSMEGIFGPAASRDDSLVELTQGDPPQKMTKPHLRLDWPGLVIYSSYLQENYYINIIFFGEYFTAK